MPPQGAEKRKPQQHSRCVQLHVNDLIKGGISEFSKKGPNGEIPLVICPSQRSPYSMLLTVPTGMSCIVQHFGQNVGVYDPGLYFKSGLFWRIAYVVTQQSCTYDAPVAYCPTADNVRVSVDIVVVFKISDALKFVEKIGPTNFDDLLTATVDEGIRMLVRGVDHLSVYTLRGDQAQETLRVLNKTFEDCGVLFQDCMVTGVWLPDNLSSCLEGTTKVDKAMTRLTRQNEYETLQIKQESEMTIEELKRKVEQTVVMENGRKRRTELEFEQRSVKTEEEGRINLIKAEQKAAVAIMQTQAALNRKKTELETYRIKELATANAAHVTAQIEADEMQEVMIANAEAAEQQMKCDSQATKHEAQAEKIATKCLVAKRRHELELREKSILAMLAETGHFNLVGTSGDRIINSMLTGSLKR